MIDNNIVPIKNNKRLCHKCLEMHKNIKHFFIRDRLFGSEFDMEIIEIQLCNSCIKSLGGKNFLKSVFNEKPIFEDKYIAKYKNENKLIDLLNDFPIQSREIIFNKNKIGIFPVINSQDYIDMQLNKAPHETYEKYGFISPYDNEKFLSCEHNELISHSSFCKYGACGDKFRLIFTKGNGTCATCEYYKRKELITNE